jgi:mannose-6-phosphate isomerase-like protein (cupin superfamily)
VAPNATIGEHAHADDEEIYFVLEGRGTIILDGKRFPIGPGDLAVTSAGHSHGLVNGPAPMRLVVACARSG